MIGGMGWTEILVVAFVVVAVLGARRIPDVFRGLGEGIREFRSAVKEAGPKDAGGGT